MERMLEFSCIKKFYPYSTDSRIKKLRDDIKDVLDYKILLNIGVFETLID